MNRNDVETLRRIRLRIDVLDAELEHRLLERVQLSRHAQDIKKHLGVKRVDEARERDILSKRPEVLRGIWQAVFRTCRGPDAG